MDIDPLDYQGMLQAACNAYCNMYLNKYNMYPTVGKDTSHKAYKIIVQLCLDNQVEINDYISACFNMIEKERRYITPGDFATFSFIKRYKERNKAADTITTEEQYDVQYKDILRMMELNPKLYPTEESVLINIGTPFSPWFRVLYPDPFNEKLFKYYGQLAWKELQLDKAMRIYLRKIKAQQMMELESRIGFFGDI